MYCTWYQEVNIDTSTSIPICHTADGARTERSEMARERERNEVGGRGRERREEGKPRQVFSLSASLLRRRYISSRRKKFNVAVKADGNADCGLWASPVTVLHRTMQHLSKWPVVLSPPFVRLGRPLLAASRSPRIYLEPINFAGNSSREPGILRGFSKIRVHQIPLYPGL